MCKHPHLSDGGLQEDFLPAHLLNGALSLEQDASSQQLGEDAAHGPDVNGRAVVPAAHQHLRRSVVLRHHLLGHVT